MVRNRTGTQPEYTPVDHEHHLRIVRAVGYEPGCRTIILAEEVVRGCRADASADSFARELASWLRFCRTAGIEPLDATPRDVARYLATLSNYAIGTQHLKLLVARMFFKRAIEHRWLLDNPVVIPRDVRRMPETDTPSLTREQAELLLSSITADFDDPVVGLTAKRDYAMISTAIRLALRAGELGTVRWGRISVSNGERRISFRGKGGKPTTMLVPADLWATLEKWRRAYEAATGLTLGPADPLFVATSRPQLKAASARIAGAPLPRLTRGAIYGVVNRRLADIGITGDRFGPHCLRATAAVLSYLGGSTIIEIQAFLRHEQVETTMRYLVRLMQGASSAAIGNIVLTVPEWAEDPPAIAGGDERHEEVA